jgi:hypothetical protein
MEILHRKIPFHRRMKLRLLLLYMGMGLFFWNSVNSDKGLTDRALFLFQILLNGQNKEHAEVKEYNASLG